MRVRKARRAGKNSPFLKGGKAAGPASSPEDFQAGGNRPLAWRGIFSRNYIESQLAEYVTIFTDVWSKR